MSNRKVVLSDNLLSSGPGRHIPRPGLQPVSTGNAPACPQLPASPDGPCPVWWELKQSPASEPPSWFSLLERII